jgi:hypothetical protein
MNCPSNHTFSHPPLPNPLILTISPTESWRTDRRYITNPVAEFTTEKLLKNKISEPWWSSSWHPNPVFSRHRFRSSCRHLPQRTKQITSINTINHRNIVYIKYISYNEQYNRPLLKKIVGSLLPTSCFHALMDSHSHHMPKLLAIIIDVLIKLFNLNSFHSKRGSSQMSDFVC